MERLKGIDASFLYMETPKMPLHVAFATVLDPAEMPGGYSYQSVVNLIAHRVQSKAPFRRRLVQVPLDLHHPLWVEDPDFDIIHHVRQVALPRPGGDKELGAMIGRIYSTPLDRRRALWEAWVIEGLEGGRFCLVLKFHHALVDGVSGAGLVMHLFAPTAQTAPMSLPPPVERERIPSDAELITAALRSRARQPLGFAKALGDAVPRFAGVLWRRRKPESIKGPLPFEAPPTHFNASISARRNVAMARVALAELKVVKNAFGVTLNDAVLALAGGVLRRYLQGRGSLPSRSLIAVCPISVRAESETEDYNNRVSAMFATLGTDVEDPAERIRIIHQATKGAKADFQAIGADTLTQWAEFAAPRTFNTAMRFYSSMNLASRHRPVHNLVVSNVPGPRFPIYLAGARVEAIYPVGPVMEGAGLNLTLMSYRDSVDLAFICDSELVPDVWAMAEAVPDAHAELLDAARLEGAARRNVRPIA